VFKNVFKAPDILTGILTFANATSLSDSSCSRSFLSPCSYQDVERGWRQRRLTFNEELVLTSVTGTAFALQPGTVSDNGGLALKKFEGDTTIFSRAGTSGCGRTENSGQLDCAQQAQAQLSASGGGLPTCSSSGEIAVTMHQVNQDGAGPLKAFIDTTGTGQNFQKATVGPSEDF
jgi:hypothetical protein